MNLAESVSETTRWNDVKRDSSWQQWIPMDFIDSEVLSGDIPWNLGLKNKPKIYGRYLQ